MTRPFGLVTGLGLAAGIYYYRAIARAVEQRNDVLDITMVHGNVPTVYGFMERHDVEGLAEYLLGFIRRLAAAGAEVAAISAVMPHAAIGAVKERSPIPIVSILDAVANAVKAARYDRVALFGARYSVESRLYGALAERTVVKLPAHEEERLFEVYREVAQGKTTDAYVQELFALGTRTIHAGDAQAIVLAGTDLTSLFEGKSIPFPTIDAVGAHVDAIVDALT